MTEVTIHTSSYYLDTVVYTLSLLDSEKRFKLIPPVDIPEIESKRTEALLQYQILDTAPEDSFDALTRLAAYICQTPVASIGLTDRNRQWFKSKIGFNSKEEPRDDTFCAYTILHNDLFVVQDTLTDERFATNPFVISDPYIRFYAGVPLVNLDGLILGTLCVLDYIPRNLSSEQQEALHIVAFQVVTQLELRRNLKVLKQNLSEREILLKEINHRVKNNLQIISGLLQLQSQSVTDSHTIDILRESQYRVESMSLIHKQLYSSSNLGETNLADYIPSLASNLLASYQITPGHVILHMDLAPILLNIDQAVPCGLIINELVSNALKYAFPGNRKGEIQIHLHTALGNQVELTIQDNGIGLPETVNWQYVQSLGLSLVHDLVVEQLEGSLTVERDGGTTFRIQFPQAPLLTA